MDKVEAYKWIQSFLLSFLHKLKKKKQKAVMIISEK